MAGDPASTEHPHAFEALIERDTKLPQRQVLFVQYVHGSRAARARARGGAPRREENFGYLRFGRQIWAHNNVNNSSDGQH